MRRSVVTTVIAIASAAVASPAAAQFASPFHVIPVVAKVAGSQGTDWRSDGSITNLSDRPVTVRMEFLREARNNAFTGSFSKSVNVAAGETRTIEDILGTYFPNEGNTKGMLLLMADDNGTDSQMLAVSTRTYNAANPNATYGQTVPSNFLGVLFGLGRSVMPGASWDSRFRTNVGVCNIGPAPVSVVIDVYRPNGSLVSSVTRTVESFSLRQWRLADLGVSSLSGGRVEVRLDDGAAGFDPCDPGSVPFLSSLLMTYFSKVDNATGDAEFGYGQLVWDEYANTCGSDPTDGCGSGGMTTLVGDALGLDLR